MTSAMAAALRCVIVEDQLMFLELLQQLLERQLGIEVIATAASTQAGVAACRLHRPDLLILDLSLADGAGLPVLASLDQAAGFVCPEALEPLLLGVIDQTTTFRDLIGVIAELLPPAPAADPGALTPAQQRIFSLIGQGLSNKQIARDLALSVATVETHRKAIARRLGCSGGELVRQAALQRERG